MNMVIVSPVFEFTLSISLKSFFLDRAGNYNFAV